ncbi:hypothetical protein ACJX0J_040311, partial [Zea mays]
GNKAKRMGFDFQASNKMHHIKDHWVLQFALYTIILYLYITVYAWMGRIEAATAAAAYEDFFLCINNAVFTYFLNTLFLTLSPIIIILFMTTVVPLCGLRSRPSNLDQVVLINWKIIELSVSLKDYDMDLYFVTTVGLFSWIQPCLWKIFSVFFLKWSLVEDTKINYSGLITRKMALNGKNWATIYWYAFQFQGVGLS